MPDDRTLRSPRPPAPRREDGSRTTPADPGRRAGQEATIQAVSDLLSLKKPALDKLARSAPVRLPDFPGTPDVTARRLENGPAARARFDTPGALLPPLPLSVPEAPRAEQIGEDDRPSPSSTASGPMPVTRSAPAQVPSSGSTSPPIDVAPPKPSVATGGGPQLIGLGGSDPRADVEAVPDHPVSAPARDLPQSDATTGRPDTGGPARRIDEEASPRPPVPSDSVRVMGPVGPAGLASPAPAGDLAPRGSKAEEFPANAPRQDSGAVRPSMAEGIARDAKPDLGAGTIGVRASLAVGPRDLSGPSLGASGDPGGNSSGFGGAGLGIGFGPGGDGPGSAGSQAAGGMDLSKTNELLQQLLEAVRSRRDAALPVGGPSVYSGR